MCTQGSGMVSPKGPGWLGPLHDLDQAMVKACHAPPHDFWLKLAQIPEWKSRKEKLFTGPLHAQKRDSIPGQ